MKTYDVIVVGAGPGGTTCASYLSRAGVRVLLLDKAKFPRDKACAGSQSEVTIAHVKELGAIEEVRRNGYPNKGLMLTAPDYTKCFLEAPGERFNTPRMVFDNIMKNTAVRWGAELLEECWAYDVVRQGGQVAGVKVRYRDENVEFYSRIVIGADGADSMIAQAAGMFADTSSNVGVAMSCFFEGVTTAGYNEVHFDRSTLPGYVWIFPCGKQPDMVNVGLGTRGDLLQGTSLVKYFHEFVKSSPYSERLRHARQVSEWSGSRLPQGVQADRNFTAGLMLIGDAGSFVIPLIGEGVGTAMETAKMAADTSIEALDSNDFSEKILGRYAERWQAAFGVKFQNMKALEKAFQHPADINQLVRKFLSNDEFKQAMLKQMYLVRSKTLTSARSGWNSW